MNAFEQSQVLRQSGKLRGAREELLKCSQLSCRQALQVPCTRWLEEVETATPSIIVRATADGDDRTDVRVEMDGELLAEELSGKAIEVDPGLHVFRLLHANYPPIEKKLLMREGEKRRILSIAFDTPKPETKHDVDERHETEQAAMHRPVPVLTYALAGVALAGFGAFGYLGITAKDRQKELEKSCEPNCPDREVDALHARLLAANVALGVGAAAAIGAVLVYATRPSVALHEPAMSAKVSVTPNAVMSSATFKF